MHSTGTRYSRLCVLRKRFRAAALNIPKPLENVPFTATSYNALWMAGIWFKLFPQLVYV
jgi:hypothetical protein